MILCCKNPVAIVGFIVLVVLASTQPGEVAFCSNGSGFRVLTAVWFHPCVPLSASLVPE
jgi:hypothetical protein